MILLKTFKKLIKSKKNRQIIILILIIQKHLFITFIKMYQRQTI